MQRTPPLLGEHLTDRIYHLEPSKSLRRAHISLSGHAQPCGHPSPRPPRGSRSTTPGGPRSDLALVPSSAPASASPSCPPGTSSGAPGRAPSGSLAPLDMEVPAYRRNAMADGGAKRVGFGRPLCATIAAIIAVTVAGCGDVGPCGPVTTSRTVFSADAGWFFDAGSPSASQVGCGAVCPPRSPTQLRLLIGCKTNGASDSVVSVSCTYSEQCG